MGLAPRERETLAAIENQLRTKDPGLESMFRVFGNRDPRGRRQPRMSISPCVARLGPGNMIILLATIVTLLITCAVVPALLA